MTITIRHLLTVLLALMLVSQSAFAMLDFHHLGQPETSSHQFDHSHQSTDTQSDNKFTTNKSENSTHALFDCHHCCHCNGPVVFTQTTSYFAARLLANSQPDYQTKPTSGIPPSLFRPPIA